MAFIVHTGHVVFLVARANRPAMSTSPASSTARRLPACSDVIVMPWPYVGLKLTTASPNGTMPDGKRSIRS
jgi:hypothetical protein